MHPLFPAMAGGILLSVQMGPYKAVHDTDNGFSLTFPGDWGIEPVTGEAIRLKIKAGELICQVSTSLYDKSASGKPSDPKTFIEKDWSTENWRQVIGTTYSTANFSNERLEWFPDGYPVRVADVDFTLGDKKSGLHGHSRIAFSIRGARFGYVNCMVMGENVERVAEKWIWVAGPAWKVVSSFVLERP